jgi:hypothetical protein
MFFGQCESAGSVPAPAAAKSSTIATTSASAVASSTVIAPTAVIAVTLGRSVLGGFVHPVGEVAEGVGDLARKVVDAGDRAQGEDGREQTVFDHVLRGFVAAQSGEDELRCAWGGSLRRGLCWDPLRLTQCWLDCFGLDS